jgi:hypothetical protein
MSIVPLLAHLASTSGLSTEDLNQPFARRRGWNIVVYCRLDFREGIFTKENQPKGGETMRHLHPEQWMNFTAKVETLCGEILHAIERDRYSPAEVIQAACNIITAAIDETADKEVAIQATQRWIKTSLERAKAGNELTHYLN